MAKAKRKTSAKGGDLSSKKNKAAPEAQLPIEEEPTGLEERGEELEEDVQDSAEDVEPGEPSSKSTYSPLVTPWTREQAIPKPIALVASIILLACVLLFGVLLFNGMKGAVKGGGPSPSNTNGDTVDVTGLFSEVMNGTQPVPGQTFSECLVGYGIDPKLPIFAFLPTCSHCEKMAPVIARLETTGHSFSWLDMSETGNRPITSRCLGISVDTVPRLICPSTRAEKSGELTEDEIIAFAETCKNA